jgi:type II restriction/modification system DNA methylase subunit YeeA
LKALKDIEHKTHLEAAAMGLDMQADLVTGPHNMLGIELNEYAAELARVTVWIGELQWRLSHGYEFKKNPVLEPLDNIECRDALLSFVDSSVAGRGNGNEARVGQTPAAHTLRFLKSPQMSAPPVPRHVGTEGSNLGSDPRPKAAGSDPNLGASNLRIQLTKAVEASWPASSIVIGNPPFLGGSKKRRELGDAYFEALDTVFAGRVPGGADLVCYWFDKARLAIETKGLGAAGLVATQSIRSGSNRVVLDAIRNKTRIFDAWSDEPWVNNGAAVRVSLVSFGWGECCFLNGQRVEQITAELGSSNASDMSLAKPLPENAAVAFKGAEKSGSFEIPGELARKWLRLPNPHGKSNADVLKPWFNGNDIVDGRPCDHWVVDFGVSTSEAEAALYEAPFAYVLKEVKPIRMQNKDRGRRENWWRFGRNGAEMRAGVNGLPRYLVTVRTAKHRTFVWFKPSCSPDSRLFVIARDDDTTLGVLSSRLHEAWSLANASMHGVGNDPTYNAKSCFETFPFPTNGLKVRGSAAAIAQAAKRLNDLREAWLNPPDWTDRVPEVTPLGMASSPYPDRILPKPGHEKDLAERTLTKLYNARPARLDAAHKALDEAVAVAYGWADYTPDMPDEEVLNRLLALNLGRASGEKTIDTKK